MNHRSTTFSASNPRFGNLGIFSLGVIAVALATLQGCAPSSLTASRAIEPGVSMPPLGSLEADVSPRAEHPRGDDRTATARAAARPAEGRGFRPEYCRRCAQ